MKDKTIRFINARYKEEFRIPDGSVVKIEDRQHNVSYVKCQYIDNYHTLLGDDVYHICQLAEFCEKNDLKLSPEKPSEDKSASWEIGSGILYLKIDRNDNDWNYSFFNKNKTFISGGCIKNSNCSIEEIRDTLLSDLGFSRKMMVKV